MTTQSGVVATNQPGVAVPGWLSNAITGVDAVYSGVLQFAEESIKHTPAGRVIRLVDLASGTVHSVASNGGFNERAYISAASSYAGGAFGSAMGSFAGPLGSALGATAGSYLGAPRKMGDFRG